MEITTLDRDIKLRYVTATSFPDGIEDAYKSLHKKLDDEPGRTYYGLSRPEGSAIVYRACVEELQGGEAEKLGLPVVVIKKGRYISLSINDFMKKPTAIGDAFKELLSYPGIDPDGYCVERYLNDKDVRCMVRLKD